MTYKLSQLGHDVHNWSVTVVHAVNVSTTRRRVELRRYEWPLKYSTSRIPACDVRTDGQTDRQTAPPMPKSRSSIAERDRNWWGKVKQLVNTDSTVAWGEIRVSRPKCKLKKSRVNGDEWDVVACRAWPTTMQYRPTLLPSWLHDDTPHACDPSVCVVRLRHLALIGLLRVISRANTRR